MFKVIHTIVYLRLSQLYFLVVRRFFAYRGGNEVYDARVNKAMRLAAPIEIPQEGLRAYGFRFVGETREFEKGNIDWDSRDMSMLWRFNLHYFDYLRDPGKSASEKHDLIQNWIGSVERSNTVGWDPFTASLRVVNWIFYLLASGTSLSENDAKSMFRQVIFIEKNDERELLANHYFENLKALLFAGVFFTGPTASRWRQRAITDIRKEMREQTLADGGHFERSPQYHCLMLENYLDIYNLALNNIDCFDKAFIEEVREVIQRSIHWLETVVFPDGDIPLFNDSAFGVAPTLGELQAYAKQLGDINVCSSIESQLIDLPETGLYGVRRDACMLVMDCGSVGPRYQPGHTHCDFLSYELMSGNRRVVVDTGVCEYKPGELRHYLRSTAAHNTLAVDGLEQSEIWGEFRVGRRARKLGATVIQRFDSCGEAVEIVGEYEGFFSGSFWPLPKFRHERKMHVKLLKDSIRSVQIVDTIRPRSGESGNARLVESFVHFHSDLTVTAVQSVQNRAREVSVGDSSSRPLRFNVELEGRLLAMVDVPSGVEAELSEGLYCPKFGVAKHAPLLVIHKRAPEGGFELPVQLEYKITLIDSES